MTKHPKKPNISAEESALFQDAMSDVKPLKREATTTPIQEPAPIEEDSDAIDTVDTPIEIRIVKPFRIGQKVPIEKIEQPRMHHDTVSGDDSIHFHQIGIQRRIRSQLRQGKLPIEATLDLHSHTADEAIRATGDFLEKCHELKKRIACIIHGKGRGSTQAPVIKNTLNTYLRHHPYVLAFHSARPKDGGTGALYVLLRTRAL